MIIKTDAVGGILCSWYAACTNAADGTVEHVILGPVPTCERCADRHDLALVPADLALEV